MIFKSGIVELSYISRSRSDPENATSPSRQSQPGANGDNTSPALPAPQQGAAAAGRPDPESLPYNHLYSRRVNSALVFDYD